MTELIVNLALLLAVLVVVVTLAIGGLRRRRTERLRQNDERSLILQAFIAAAPPPFAPSPAAAQPDVTPPAAVPNPVGQPSQLDVQSVAALLDLLEGRPPTRRGLARSVISSPRSIWSAGETAGRQAGQRTMAGSRPGPADNAAGELYRDAATELVEIFGYDPRDAHEQFQRYAAAIGDPGLAELYVRSAAYSAHPDNPSTVSAVVHEITRSLRVQEVSDAGDIIES